MLTVYDNIYDVQLLYQVNFVDTLYIHIKIKAMTRTLPCMLSTNTFCHTGCRLQERCAPNERAPHGWRRLYDQTIANKYLPIPDHSYAMHTMDIIDYTFRLTDDYNWFSARFSTLVNLTDDQQMLVFTQVYEGYITQTWPDPRMGSMIGHLITRDNIPLKKKTRLVRTASVYRPLNRRMSSSFLSALVMAILAGTALSHDTSISTTSYAPIPIDWNTDTPEIEVLTAATDIVIEDVIDVQQSAECITEMIELNISVVQPSQLIYMVALMITMFRHYIKQDPSPNRLTRTLYYTLQRSAVSFLYTRLITAVGFETPTIIPDEFISIMMCIHDIMEMVPHILGWEQNRSNNLTRESPDQHEVGRCGNTGNNRVEKCTECDGKLDSFLYSEIPPGQGVCVNGYCYNAENMDKMYSMNMDPYVRTRFSLIDKLTMRHLRIIDTDDYNKMLDWMDESGRLSTVMDRPDMMNYIYVIANQIMFICYHARTKDDMIRGIYRLTFQIFAGFDLVLHANKLIRTL